MKPRVKIKTAAEKAPAIAHALEAIWLELFSSPVHLDSALSKRPAATKRVLAQIVPRLLLRPASEAEALGVGVPEGEPWSARELARWRPAISAGERLYASMANPPRPPAPLAEDFPPAMLDEWKREWGASVTSELVRTLASEPPLSLRAARAIGAQAVLDGLKKEKIPVRAGLSPLSPAGVTLAGYAPVLGLPLYDQGAFEIQDEGSQLMSFFALWPDSFAERLRPEPGAAPAVRATALPEITEAQAGALRVVDACAGAGGKTLALADALGGRGRVYAYDTSEKKLQALKRRASRAGLRNVQAVKVDEGREADVVGKFAGGADVVLVDAPCSGWGVLRRNPDIKWRQKPDALERMPKIQSRLLDAYSALVKPGGRLVFGVCTFRKAETLEVVEGFLRAHPEFSRGPGGYLGPGPCDGFFMQAFTKRVS